MESDDELCNETNTPIDVIAVTPPQSMQGLIDFIDLTQDTPRNRRTLKKRVPATSAASNAGSLNARRTRKTQQPSPNEVIHVDDSPQAKSCTVPCINDSLSGGQVPLTCPVCLEELSSKVKPMATRCGHIFCEGCLQAVSRTTKKCPSCQTRFTPKSLTRLYF